MSACPLQRDSCGSVPPPVSVGHRREAGAVGAGFGFCILLNRSEEASPKSWSVRSGEGGAVVREGI